MIQFECISRPFSCRACICFSNREPVNEIIENIHYATVYFFHFICAVCLLKYLTVMTLRCDEWRIGSPFLSWKKPFIMPRSSRTEFVKLFTVPYLSGGVWEGSDQQPRPAAANTEASFTRRPPDSSHFCFSFCSRRGLLRTFSIHVVHNMAACTVRKTR